MSEQDEMNQQVNALDAEIREKNGEIEELRAKLHSDIATSQEQGTPVDFEQLGKQVLNALGIDFGKIEAIAESLDQTVELVKSIVPQAPAPAPNERIAATLRVHTVDGKVHEIPGVVREVNVQHPDLPVCESDHDDSPECDCNECIDEKMKWVSCGNCGGGSYYSGFYVNKLENDISKLMDIVEDYGERLSNVAHRVEHWEGSAKHPSTNDNARRLINKLCGHIREVL